MGRDDCDQQLIGSPMSSVSLTVLLPVFNAGVHLEEAIKSLLCQTFSSFEILAINDGSTDNSGAIIRSMRDERIRLVEHSKNFGVAETLNRGIELATGRYIARMDADDICKPNRLEKQWRFMEAHPEVGISGTWIKYFGEQPPLLERKPLDSEVIRAYMLFDNPLFHPTVIMRKSFLDQYALRYDPTFHRTEDYDLWSRAVRFFSLGNIPEPLLKFRCHGGSVTSTAALSMRTQTLDIMRRELSHIGISPSDDELRFHYRIGKGERMESAALLIKAEAWLARLYEKNRKTGYCPPRAFLSAIGMIWYRLCFNSAQIGAVVWKVYKKSEFSSLYTPSTAEKGRFILSVCYNLCRGKSRERS
ncbi:MAG: glycosyltransferase [Candidatus Electrothrix sp. AUS1_2]|nr:glycosyltransferase [Candidatus Electrothrix sp. AUS1_2]